MDANRPNTKELVIGSLQVAAFAIIFVNAYINWIFSDFMGYHSKTRVVLAILWFLLILPLLFIQLFITRISYRKLNYRARLTDFPSEDDYKNYKSWEHRFAVKFFLFFMSLYAIALYLTIMFSSYILEPFLKQYFPSFLLLAP